MNLMTIMLQTEGAPQGMGMSGMIIFFVLMFAVMYLFMIRPQQKKQKEMMNFRNSLQKGDKIVTAGGIYGIIKEVKENSVLIEVDGNVTLRVDKSMIMRSPESSAPSK